MIVEFLALIGNVVEGGMEKTKIVQQEVQVSCDHRMAMIVRRRPLRRAGSSQMFGHLLELLEIEALVLSCLSGLESCRDES